MNFKEYQNEAKKTAVYPGMCVVVEDYRGMCDTDLRRVDYLYPLLGLMGESGEVCEKIKKIVRDGFGHISIGQREELKKEIGDILWYIAMLCKELDIDMNEVAELNIKKLKDRQERNKLHGQGDSR